MTLKRTPIGRLAFRHEGNMWNAYYALEGTMDGAIQLGSIFMAAVVENPARKQAFMDLMTGFVADIIKDETGQKPDWTAPRDAPEREKAGHS